MDLDFEIFDYPKNEFVYSYPVTFNPHQVIKDTGLVHGLEYQKHGIHSNEVFRSLFQKLNNDNLLLLYRFLHEKISHADFDYFLHDIMDLNLKTSDADLRSKLMLNGTKVSVSPYKYLHRLRSKPHLLLGCLLKEWQCPLFIEGPNFRHPDGLRYVRRQLLRAAFDVLVMMLLHHSWRRNQITSLEVCRWLHAIYVDVLTIFDLRVNLFYVPFEEEEKHWYERFIRDMFAGRMIMPLNRIAGPLPHFYWWCVFRQFVDEDDQTSQGFEPKETAFPDFDAKVVHWNHSFTDHEFNFISGPITSPYWQAFWYHPTIRYPDGSELESHEETVIEYHNSLSNRQEANDRWTFAVEGMKDIQPPFFYQRGDFMWELCDCLLDNGGGIPCAKCARGGDHAVIEWPEEMAEEPVAIEDEDDQDIGIHLPADDHLEQSDNFISVNVPFEAWIQSQLSSDEGIVPDNEPFIFKRSSKHERHGPEVNFSTRRRSDDRGEAWLHDTIFPSR